MVGIFNAAYDITAGLEYHMLYVHLGDISNKDLMIVEYNQFTNSIELLF